MLKNALKTVCVLSCFAAVPAQAVDRDAVIGGAIGGGVGAAVGSEVGGKEGAIAGSAIGAAIGTAVMAEDDKPREEKVYVETHTEYHDDYRRPAGPPPHAYGPPPGHVKNGKARKW